MERSAVVRTRLSLAILAAAIALSSPGGAALAAPARELESPTGGPGRIAPDVVSWGVMERATFVICGPDDPATERAIEQFIAGRGFGTALVSRGDGCAELTVMVFPGGGAGTHQSSTTTFSSGEAAPISVRIVSADGQTRVSIGSPADSPADVG